MSNLDDFFKKKDGKKKSKGKKFAVNNPLSLTSTENVKNGKVKQEKPTSFNHTLLRNENDLFSSQYGDEWKEFAEEEKKDYSGLKIQNLQINDDDNDKVKIKQESEEEIEIDDNGQTVVKKKATGPWKVIQNQKKVEEKPPEKVEAPKAAPADNIYRIPHIRDSGNSREGRSNLRKKNEVPSKEKFPALGSTVSSNSRSRTKLN